MKQILIAEDEQHIRDLITLTLKLHGMCVTSTKNGLEAMEVSAEMTYDLIILDVRMPKATGIEAALHIRNDLTNAATPILFLSGEGAIDIDHIENCRHLIKPFAIDGLLNKINQILAAPTEAS